LTEKDESKKEKDVESKLKINLLQLERKLADVELSLLKLEKKINTVDLELIEKHSARLEEFEDIISIINLGIREMKEFDTKIGDDLSKLKTEIEDKFDTLDKKIDDVRDKAVEAFTKDLKGVREHINELTKEISDITRSLMSLKKELELTDVKTFMTQLDVINEKLAELDVELHKMQTTGDVSILMKDIELLKTAYRNLSSKVLEKDMGLSELETSINILRNKIDQLDFVNTINQIRRQMRDEEKRMYTHEIKLNEIEKRINDIAYALDERFKSLENTIEKARHLGIIESMAKEMRDSVSRIEGLKLDIEEVSKRVEKMYYETDKKLNDFKKLKELYGRLEFEIGRLKSNVSSLMPGSIEAMSKKIKSLEQALLDLNSKYQSLSSTKLPEVDTTEFRRRLEAIESRQLAVEIPDIASRLSKIEKRLDKLEREIRPKGPVILE